MNKNDVFQKSELGRAEIRNQHSNLLLKEARNLLIFIDGKKTYQQYTALLDNSQMFAKTGGIAPFFELLIDLGFIELLSAGAADAHDDTHEGNALDLSSFKADDTPNNPVTPSANTAKPAPSDTFSYTIDTSTPDDSDFATFFDSQSNTHQSNTQSSNSFDNPPNSPASNDSNNNKRQSVDVHFESVKSKLATYIEQRAPAQDVWGHMLNLEQCERPAELLGFIQDIQRTDNTELSQDIDAFSKMLGQ